MDLNAINLFKSDHDIRGRGIKCRSTEIIGGILKSPQPGPATNPSIAGLQSNRDSLPYCGNVIIDDECIVNNNRHVISVKPTNNQIHLFDELELLRAENFQLRLRVYNAEQRVDRLSAAALGRDQKKREEDGMDTDSDGMDTDSDGMDTDSDGMDTDSDDMDTDNEDMDTDSDDMDTDSDDMDTDDSNGHAGSGTDLKAKAAKTAVSSIYDLLALNRRLLALMAVTASAKSPSVSADNKRRWQQLRNHIEEYTVESPNKDKTNEDNDDDDEDEFYDASSTVPETLGKVTRQNVPRPPPLASSTPLKTVSMDDGVGSDVTGLREQCTLLQSAEQPMNMDLWVPKRKFGKLEQKRCMTQVNTGKSTGRNVKAKATTEATVNTIHDLLTFNRRLLALMADTVSTKSMSVSARNRRRLHQLQSHIEEYAVVSPNKEMTTEDNDDKDDSDDKFFYASTISTGTLCKAWLVSADHSVTRQNVLHSPPPQPPQPPPSTSLEIVDTDDEGVESEVTRLQRQCRPIRSVHQLMKTELWARNRMLFGRVEQERIMTQVSYAGVHVDSIPTEKVVTAAVSAPPQRHNLQQFCTKTTALTALPPANKGILVILADANAPCTTKAPEAAYTESQTAAASTPLREVTITTHKSVFPDYSDVDFFISCDEEEDDDDEEEEEVADWNDCDEESVLSASIDVPVAYSTSRRRQCRTHRPIKNVGDSATLTPMTSSSTESEAAKIEASELNGDGVIMTEAIATLPGSSVSVGNDLNKRLRCVLPRGCSTGGVDTANRSRPSSVVDAQVQCDDGNVVADHILSSSDRGIDGELQLQQDARRVDNSLLNDVLLRYQQGMRPSDSDPSIPSSSIHEETVHSSIANLLAEDDDSDVGRGDGDHRRCRPDRVEQQLQLQLTRIRKRILGDEHQELDIGGDREDPFNDAVRRMDHADLINVALPQVVERLHQALVVLQHRPENVAAN